MPDAVFPSRRGVFKVRKMIQDPGINFLHGERFLLRIFDGHKNETGKRIGRFVLDMDQRVVWHVTIAYVLASFILEESYTRCCDKSILIFL